MFFRFFTGWKMPFRWFSIVFDTFGPISHPQNKMEDRQKLLKTLPTHFSVGVQSKIRRINKISMPQRTLLRMYAAKNVRY